MARILIVDDDEQVRAMLCATLAWAGHDADGAPNGKAAICMQRERPADLVITDIVMPEKEGLETIRDLRKGWPDTRIIAISGGGRFGAGCYLGLASRLGAGRVFQKPVDQEVLLTAISELLGEAKPVTVKGVHT